MNFFKTCRSIPIRINDTEKGDKTVVLLHGYLETSDVWESFTGLLKKDCRIISFDLPGNGLSGTLTPCNDMEFMADVTDEVLKTLNAERAVIVGHSMGGYVALAFAEKYPDKTEKLCLFHSTPNPDSDEKKEARDREIKLIEEGKIGLILKNNIVRMFADENVKRLSDTIAEIEENAEISDSEGIAACLNGMKTRKDMNDFLSKFDKPLLFIFGAKDNYISKEITETLIARFPACRYYILENSGHAGFLEEPRKSAECLRAFI